MGKSAADYRRTFINRSDDQIIEALGNEVRDKVETIHLYLEKIKKHEDLLSTLIEVSNLIGEGKTSMGDIQEIIMKAIKN